MAIELWFVFSVLSATLWASSNIIDKIVIPKHIKTPIAPLFIIGVFNLVTALAIASIIPPVSISIQDFGLSLLAGILWGIVPFIYFRSLLTQEVSRIISLFSISPLLVLVFATLFLGEVLTYDKYIGVMAIIAGSMLISVKFDKKSISVNKDLLLIIVGTFLISISQILSKAVLSGVPYWTFYVWFALGFFLSSFLISLTRLSSLKILKEVKTKHLGLLVGSRILGVGGLVAQITALSYGLASLVSAIFSIQSLLVLIFAFISSAFNHHIEELKGRSGLVKMVAIVLTIFGIFMISV